MSSVIFQKWYVVTLEHEFGIEFEITPDGFKCYELPKLQKIEKLRFRQKCEQLSKNMFGLRSVVTLKHEFGI